MDPQVLKDNAAKLADQAQRLAEQADALAGEAALLVAGGGDAAAASPFMFLFTVFVLSVFIGYYVVWSVTPALHSPLMSVTNAISSVIIVGAMIAAGPSGFSLSKFFGLAAVVLASINIFGGFIVTQRMLGMFRKRK